jgi:hypothetical protein
MGQNEFSKMIELSVNAADLQMWPNFGVLEDYCLFQSNFNEFSENRWNRPGRILFFHKITVYFTRQT